MESVEIGALIAVCYLAAGTWMLAEMEADDRLGWAWTDLLIVVAGPAAAVLWAIHDVCVATGAAAASAWSILTSPWRR